MNMNEEKTRYNEAAESVNAAKAEREKAMFGCELSFVEAQFERSISKGMYIMGILSDVQEANAMCDFESARQFANKAKYLMSKYLPKDPEGRML